MRPVRSVFAWLDEPFEATLPLAPRLRLYALCGGLVVGSVPFLHLYLEVDLTAAELVVHAIDISLGTFIVLGLTEAITSWLQGSLTWRVSVSRKALIALSALGVGAILSLQSLLHDWLPMTETIRSKHVDAGYGDMSLRVLPVVALIVRMFVASGAGVRAPPPPTMVYTMGLPVAAVRDVAVNGFAMLPSKFSATVTVFALMALPASQGEPVGQRRFLRRTPFAHTEPTSHVVPLENVLRPDEPGASLTPEQALANAPDPDRGSFRVPSPQA